MTHCSLLLLLVLLALPVAARADQPAAARLVHYSGRVQGVGFRATVADIARRYPVTGWVRNLPDGRVQVHVEGAAEAIESFLAAVRQQWAAHIHAEHIEDREPTGRYTGFDIVR